MYVFVQIISVHWFLNEGDVTLIKDNEEDDETSDWLHRNSSNRPNDLTMTNMDDQLQGNDVHVYRLIGLASPLYI